MTSRNARVRAALTFVLLCLSLTSAVAQPSGDDLLKRSHKDIERALPDAHPATYYAYASRLFQEGRKKDAVCWFYVGQLRYRVHLVANPGLPPDGDPALMASLNETIGQTINEWAGRDPDLWRSQMQCALRWDAATRNGFTPKASARAAYAQVRAGLEDLVAWVTQNRASILEQRKAAGSPDR